MAFRPRTNRMIPLVAMAVVFGLIVNALILSGLVATKTTRSIQSLDHLGQSVIVVQQQQQEQHAQQLYNKNSSNSISIDTTSVPHQLQYQHDKLMFVHIGKTAGETLKHHLRVTCTAPRRNAVKRNNCYKEWQTPTARTNDTNLTTSTTTTTTVNGGVAVRHESEISQRTVAYMHCNLLQPSSRGGINATIHDQITTHLFCIRSPVDRIISWFRYIHPNACRGSTRHGDTTAACVYKRRMVHQNNTLVTTFANCFPTLGHFLDSLGRGPSASSSSSSSSPPTTTAASAAVASNNNISIEVCAQTAHAILQATSTDVRVMGHSYFNYYYYANRTLRRYHANNNNHRRHVLAIRTEHFWSDFAQLDYLLGGRVGAYQHPNNGGITAYRHESQHIVPINMTSSAQGIFNLCCALLQDHHHHHESRGIAVDNGSEISIYLEILDRADNLNATAKRQGKMALLQQCGEFQSLEDLTTSCRRAAGRRRDQQQQQQLQTTYTTT